MGSPGRCVTWYGRCVTWYPGWGCLWLLTPGGDQGMQPPCGTFCLPLVSKRRCCVRQVARGCMQFAIQACEECPLPMGQHSTQHLMSAICAQRGKGGGSRRAAGRQARPRGEPGDGEAHRRRRCDGRRRLLRGRETSVAHILVLSQSFAPQSFSSVTYAPVSQLLDPGLALKLSRPVTPGMMPQHGYDNKLDRK